MQDYVESQSFSVILLGMPVPGFGSHPLAWKILQHNMLNIVERHLATFSCLPLEKGVLYVSGGHRNWMKFITNPTALQLSQYLQIHHWDEIVRMTACSMAVSVVAFGVGEFPRHKATSPHPFHGWNSIHVAAFQSPVINEALCQPLIVPEFSHHFWAAKRLCQAALKFQLHVQGCPPIVPVDHVAGQLAHPTTKFQELG